MSARLAAAGLAGALVLGCGGSSPKPEAASPGQPASLRVDVEPGESMPASTFARGSDRPTMRSVPFRVADLPAFMAVKDAKREKERVSSEIVVSRNGESAVLSVKPQQGRLARLSLDATSSVGLGGLRVQCGQWAAAHLSLHLLDIGDDGRATFTRVDGIFDASACEAVERSRVSVAPAALVPGYLFAFRTCTASPCESGRQTVTFLMPPLVELESEGMNAGSLPAAPAPMGIASFEHARGAAASLTAVVNEAAVAHLFDGRPRWASERPLVIGVDVASTTEEDEPVGLASFGAVTEGPARAGELVFH